MLNDYEGYKLEIGPSSPIAHSGKAFDHNGKLAFEVFVLGSPAAAQNGVMNKIDEEDRRKKMGKLDMYLPPVIAIKDPAKFYKAKAARRRKNKLANQSRRKNY